APTERYGEAIVISEILTENFEIKTNLLQLVQANKFHGFESENPHNHISNFKRMTATLKYRDVLNDAIKLMLFPYSLEDAARIWDSVSKIDDRVDKLADQISNLVEIVNKQVITPASTKAVEKTCVICGGAHAYNDCIATDIQPPVVPISILEPDVSKTQPKPTIPYPSRLNDQKLREKATNQMEKFFQIFHDLHYDISFADALLLMPKIASTIKSLLMNKDKLFELAKVPLNENCSAMLLKNLPEKLGDPGKFLIPYDFPRMDVCHALVDLGASINLMPFSIWKKLSLPKLTPTRMTLELADTSITLPKGVADDVFVKVGIYSKSRNPTLVSNPSISESDFSKDPIVKSSSPTLTPFGEIDFLSEEIEDFLNDESILTGIENSFYDPDGDILFLEKLLNEDPFQFPLIDLKQAKETKAKSSIEEPPKLELKELPSHLDPWVSPIHCVPKKGGMTVITNENNELIPTRLVIGWRVCIDYRKLNDATRKDHFPLPFMDQMLERLAGNKFYCFLDGYSRYFQIPIDPQDQEKITFTCPYGTFAYRRMPFGLCNAPGTFQRKGIVLGHKILKSGIEVDRAKVDVIAKLPHPTTVKGVRSFLGHARFYRCFNQDFSKIPRPMIHLLEKETPFVFSKERVDAFDSLRKKLTEAPILVVPDWNLPFELISDASDFAIRALLISSKLVMRDLLGAIMVPISQRRKAIISDRRTHFCNDQFIRVMIKYGVTHHLVTAYHPHTSGQVEVSNRGLKCILERTVGENRTSWAYWALKHVNFDLKTAGDHRKLQLNKLRDQAYENSVIYKKRTKKLHDSKIKNRIFNVGDQVLLFNSRLEIFSGKLKTRWSGPFTITQVFSYGTVELSQPNGPDFKVNGHHVKHYFGGVELLEPGFELDDQRLSRNGVVSLRTPRNEFSGLQGFNISLDYCSWDFLGYLRIFFEQRIAAIKGYRGRSGG
nr:DNA-directed DNA polymerase [Tanacetum cinerariifolium]